MTDKNNTAATTTTQDELAKLRAENAKLHEKLASRATFTLKVSEKDAISAYGLGRFPVTLYASQFVRLLGKAPEILAFIEENKAKLAVKPE